MGCLRILLSVLTFLSSLPAFPARRPTCQRVSRCACKMSDGSGTIDLKRDADKEFTANDIHNKDIAYSYLPCENLGQTCSNSSQFVLCESVAKNKTVVKHVVAASDNMSFVVNSTGAVTIVYHGNNNRSTVYVQLVCSPDSETSFQQMERPNSHGSQSDLYFLLENSGICLSTEAPSSTSVTTHGTATHPTSTPGHEETCSSLQDCAFDLEVAIPAAAVGVSLLVIIVSCLIFRHKDRQLSRYTTL